VTVAGASPAFVLRPPRPGDLGWIVQRHGVLYAAEYRWGSAFEALVARVAADYAAQHDPRRERCWIAEVAGDRVGSVLLVRQDDDVAKLRLLLVEPQARGLGIGQALVSECLAFARAAGYREITLFTCSVLTAARRIYEAAGFQLVREFADPLFNPGEMAQEWRRRLD
jgi:ribosomal protein S18 acetylase RimI-like enzyme